MKRDNRKRLELSCVYCSGSGLAHANSRCRECRGKGVVRIANPFYVPAGQLPTFFQLGGGEGWAREVRRQLALEQGCWSGKRARDFQAICRLLEPWRLRSAVHCNSVAIAAIAPLIEEAHRNHGVLERPGGFSANTGWSPAELGDLLVEVRNRQHLWSIGRMQARTKGPRFDLGRIPDDRLDALIQRHPNLALVDCLRAERARRLTGNLHA